jgi:hypothetical protein
MPQHTHPRGCLFLEKRKILTKKDGITAKKRGRSVCATSQFTSETGREAVMKRHHGYNEYDGHDITSDIRHDHDITSDMYPTRQEGCFIRKPVITDYSLERVRSELD